VPRAVRIICMHNPPPIEHYHERLRQLTGNSESTICGLKEVAELVNDPFRVAIICPECWPGARLFFTRLEYTHFTPGTSLNDEFTYAILQLLVGPAESQSRVNFLLSSVPIEYAGKAKDIAASYEMSLVPGLQGIGTSKGFLPFSFTSPNLYALVIPEHIMRDLKSREMDLISEITGRHVD
jgi:hypothetical protein